MYQKLLNKSVRFAKLKGKRVIVRCDLNVPLSKGIITDDTRIKESLETLRFILKSGAKQLIILSHLGRPKAYDEAYSLAPVAKKLHTYLQSPIALLKQIEPNDTKIVLVENVRFFEGEKKNDLRLAKLYASLGDIFVNDAFGSAHRAHASNSRITKYLPTYIGFLMEKEISMLSHALTPKHPFVVMLGFAKIADKIAIMEQMLKRADVVLLGGAVAFTFLEAKGISCGKSLVEVDQIQTAKKILKKYGNKIVLPFDVVCARSLTNTKSKPIVVSIENIPKDMAGYDIGPLSTKIFATYARNAKTLFWNGPVGVFEQKPYQKATYALAKAISQTKALSIVGGGDTVSAIKQSGFAHKFTHLSTGGGASLAFFESNLPALNILLKKRKK